MNADLGHDGSHKTAGNLNSDIPPNSTCRICRGEATDDNPLYFPCKCKGSIKYIHEQCLMEWISSKNMNVTKAGTKVSCDICHHEFFFKTVYSESMPEKIPFSLLALNTAVSLINKIRITVTLGLATVLLILGLPLSWNFFGKLFTFLMDGELPFADNFTKSIVFGYEKNVNNVISASSVAYQLVMNIKTALFQILLVVLFHIAVYFQYDMIIRESVFSKMVFHKIGPQYTKEELLKKQLKERFPMMEDESIEYVAKLMRERNQVVEQERVDRGNELAAEAVAAEQATERAAEVNAARQNAEAEHNIQNLESDDENDPDFVHNENDTSSDSDESLQNEAEFDDNSARELMDEGDDELFQHHELAHETIANQRAQRRFNNMLDAHIDNQRQQHVNPEVNANAQQPVELDDQDHLPEFPRNVPEAVNQQDEEAPQPVRAAPLPRDEPVVVDMDNEDRQAAGPLVINLKMKLSNVLFYYFTGLVIVASYLSISYLVPSVIGHVLIKAYQIVINTSLVGVFYVSRMLNIPHHYQKILMKNELLALVHKWVQKNVIDVIVLYYYGYLNNTMRNSIITRSAPLVVTYATAVMIICSVPNLVSYGYGRDNGVKNATRRTIFEITFSIKCTLKVFTLFFIELLGFPVFAGYMLDFSFLCPLFGRGNDFSVMASLCEPWKQFAFVIYWVIGTVYMYWFARYVGMVRQHIIRPGVLFFIRSPDDPNMKILHDSLIHPMTIQLSRLSLSIFYYAVFIVVGFGFYVRLFFPILLKSNLLTTSGFSSLWSTKLLITVVTFYIAINAVESRQGVKFYIRQYWIKIFEISSSKLRLTSFILGHDMPSERGHLVYRNLFYRLFAARSAEWSNPELYSSPKTPDQTKILFQENSSVHAYFVPDGSLMRVPSSDIVSRNYVQTLFVPVTKSDKLLKPLDSKRIIERNKKNVGEFGYLDEQSTEFDGYSIAYTPPNFRLKYTILICLIWTFSAILFIGVALASQYLFNSLMALIVLPYALYLNWKNAGSIQNVKQHILNGYKQLDFNFVFFGSVIIAYCIDKYYYYDLAYKKFKEHVVPVVDNEDEQNANDNENLQEQRAQFNNDAIPMRAIFADMMQGTTFKWFLTMLCTSSLVSLRVPFVLFNTTQLILFGGGYWSNNLYDLMKNLLETSTNMRSPQTALENNTRMIVYLWIMLQHVVIFRDMLSVYMNNRNATSMQLMKSLFSYMRKSLAFAFVTTLPVCMVWLACAGVEYYNNKQNYNSLLSVIYFLWKLRLDPDHSHIAWTIPQKLCYQLSTVILLGVFVWNTISAVRKWFGVAIQNVKDDVYAKGRALENFSD